MVHSGFSSPMKTSALPLPASTAVPPAPTAVSTEQSSPQTPIKPDSCKVSTLNPSNAEAPVINASFTASSTLIATPAQPAFNGRTSGRKRTPKSCDCCGPKGHGHNVPKGHGHNVQTPNRGRGRPRGRARGSGNVTAVEETPKRKLGGLLTYAKSPHVTNKQFGEVIGAEMGVDDPSQNFTDMPDLHGVAANAAPSDIKDMQMEKSLTANESVKYNDIEMNVADKPVVLVQSSRTVMASTTTPGEIKRKMDDNVLCSNIQISFKKQAKLEQEEKADPKPLPQNGESNSPTNCLQSSGKAGGATHVANGPITVATKPVHISAVDLTSAEQNSENTNDVPLSLSNGDSFAAVPLDDTQEVIITADLQNSRPVPVPPKEPISVRSEAHPRALHDHSVYCRLGTWDKTEKTGETGDEEQEEEGEQLLEMVHEFLESFYVKYGSFIPLAENDVVEHLKQKGKSDLTDKAVDIEKQVTRYRAGLASAPVAGFAVAHNRHTLSLEDLSTLEEQNWINDQIINMYGELIMEATEQKVHFFNSFFHKQLVAKGYEGVKRWTKKIDLFSKWLVLIPIHLEIHWSLVTVSMAHKTISYYDSQGIVFRHTTENIMKYLLAEAKEKKQTAFQKGWKITIVKGIPQQKNDSDCGVFVLEYCRCLSVKQPFRFSQEDMPRIRKRIYKELCDCHLDV